MAKPWFRRKPAIIGTSLAVVTAVAVTSVVLVTSAGPDSPQGQQPAANTTTVGDATYAEAIDLPSTGLTEVRGIAATNTNVVAGLSGTNQIFRMRAAPDTPTIADMKEAVGPGFAIDEQGNAYVAGKQAGVLRLDGSLAQTTLPFPAMHIPTAVGIDATGAVYVLDTDDTAGSMNAVTNVWKLDAGASVAVKLPFDKFSGTNMAVDKSDGTVYVVDGLTNTVLKLDAGTTRATSIPIRQGARGLAVDTDGALYVAIAQSSGGQVFRYTRGSTTGDALPITNVDFSLVYNAAIAVDGNGSVYVVDDPKNQVVELPRVKP